MRTLLSTIIATLIISISTLSSSLLAYNAKPWNLPGVTIIPRSAWIIDESIIYRSAQSPVTTNTDNDDTTPVAPTRTQIISSYLTTLFPEQVLLNGIIRTVNNQTLRRARGYKNVKTHIVIHHTAQDAREITTVEQARANLNNILRFHTITNARGDIGYNFVIDPFGNIYEGRGGGEGIVGAHARYNNAPSVGISLIGNFELHEPTEAQITALKQLTTAVSVRYRINPDSEVHGHIDHHEHPFVRSVVTSTIIGHKDVGKTACPGTHLYKRLPEIRQHVRAELIRQNKSFPIRKAPQIHNHTIPVTIDGNRGQTTLPITTRSAIRVCRSNNRNLVVRCNRTTNGTTLISLSKRSSKMSASGPVIITMNTRDRNESYKIAMDVQWMSDQALLLEERKNLYIRKNNITPNKNLSTKFVRPIPVSSITTLTQQPVNVLLYEASTTLSERRFLCQQCTVTDDRGRIYTDRSFTIQNNGTYLSYIPRDGRSVIVNSITITPTNLNNVSFITNYDRKSFAGIAWNNFYGTLTISRQPIQLLGANSLTEQYVIVNSLPFDLYMRGIIESNDTEPTEKSKAMTLLARNYILFYLSPAHRHPSIPANASYNAVDDARIFQKYVGAGVDQTLQTRKQSLEATANQVVMYNDNLAFLPYFSCSAGFTRSGQEKRGRTDTPYLVSVFDPAPCDDFRGHGVGLAGNGATKLANDGKTYEEIIQYFYPGVRITTY